MVQLIVSEEQAKTIENAASEIEVRDACGRLLGTLAPALPVDDVAAMLRTAASDQPRYTTQQVLDHLNSLAPQ